MKKILTVSLFAIMAVSAANAEIASTDYVGTQMNLAEKIANKVTIVDQNSVDEKYPSAKAVYTAIKSEVNALGTDVDELIETQLEAVTDQIDEASDKILNLENALKADGATGQSIAAAQAQADKGVADAAAAKAAADAAQADANANADAISKLDTTYVSENEMTAFKSTNSEAIATAKSEAITEAANAAKIYIDADELDASQTAQDTILKKYADDAAAAVGTAASAALTTKLADYSTTAQMNSAIATADTATLNSAKAYTDELANGAVKDNTDAISAINNATTGILAKAQQYADANDADTIYDDTAVRGLISTNAADIEAIEKSAYATSGVTSETVAQVATNKTDIATINSSDVMKSGVDADVVAKANSAMQETALKGLATWTSQGCATGTCSLVSKNGSIAWEKVSY